MADDELTRKIGKAVVVVTTPDVCKAPTVPTPFVSYSKFDLSVKTADSVRMTSCVSFTKDSRLSMTLADQGGVGGGVKSQVMGGMCRPFKGWCSTVRAQGSEICRHDVMMEVNCAGPEGPGNTYGKVIYIESLVCASITPQNEIVVDEPKVKESAKDSDESPTENEKSNESEASESGAGEGEASESDEGGFGEEAKKRVEGEIDDLKQTGKDVYDLATSPEARQKTMDAAKETAGAMAEDPVGFGKAAGTEILNDVLEPFKTAGGQASEGNIGGAGASVVYGILNVFNPAKKLKILQKIGKLGGKKKKKKGGDGDKKKDGNDDDKKDGDDEKKDGGDDDNDNGEDGGTVKKKSGEFADPDKLQDHYDRHGKDFDAKSPQDYQSKADDFLNGEKGDGVLEKVRPNGDVVRYDPTSDSFGVAKPDGTVRTFYKPDPSVHGHSSNLDYFNAQ